MDMDMDDKSTKLPVSGNNNNNNEKRSSSGIGSSVAKSKNTSVASPSLPSTDPIVPKIISPPPNNVVWQSLHDNHVLIRKPSTNKKTDGSCMTTKVAAFDLDGTLVVWSSSFSGFWPNQLTHYELWSSTVPDKLRSLYDENGYQLVLFTNQGGIQKAHTGKKATLVKHVINFLAHLIDRPVYAVMSTKSLKKSPETLFHKPTPKMWQVAQQEFLSSKTKGMEYDLASSFFVGDSADPNDEQGGVDFKFAQAVTEEKKKRHGNTKNIDTLKFYTPTEFFGPSDSERRQKEDSLQSDMSSPPPKEALDARSALLGGYLEGPILLILCGVQGSGKSTFCQQLLGNDDGGDADNASAYNNDHWIHLSQDTINNGKPGKREKVQAEAKAALERGKCVVVDRMHLDPEQREYFVQVAQSVQVPVHALLMNPPREVIGKRVRERTDHPGKVQGEDGARRALQSLDKLVVPTYSEPLQLITTACTMYDVSKWAQLYKGVVVVGCGSDKNKSLDQQPVREIPLSDSGISIPTMALGTMGIGKKVTKDAVLVATRAGFRAIDTAPTYKNEDRVGDAISDMDGDDKNIFCIAKIPKAATQPDQVRSELEATLTKLQRSYVNLLLLHWPCDVITAATLESVWKEMEDCHKEGKCKALGVCNFNVNALALLLAKCSTPPVVNQVERHPLLQQMDLVDFCARNNILLQAHTPLGQGKDELLAHPSITSIAKQHSLTPAQVVLQWNIRQGVMVVPKCSNEQHAQELVAASSSKTLLSPKDMQVLDSLDQGKRFVTPPFMYGKHGFCWGTHMPRK